MQMEFVEHIFKIGTLCLKEAEKRDIFILIYGSFF